MRFSDLRLIPQGDFFMGLIFYRALITPAVALLLFNYRLSCNFLYTAFSFVILLVIPGFLGNTLLSGLSFLFIVHTHLTLVHSYVSKDLRGKIGLQHLLRLLLVMDALIRLGHELEYLTTEVIPFSLLYQICG